MNPKTILNFAKGLIPGGVDNTIELPAPQSLYDRIINGINRLGRPLLLIAVFSFFVWSIYDPSYFATVMKALGEAPEYVQQIILLVVTIFGTGRIIGDVKKKTTLKQSSKKQEISEPAHKPTLSEMAHNKDKGIFENLNKDDSELIVNNSSKNQAIKEWKKNAAK